MFKSARVCVAVATMSFGLLGCGGAGNIGTGTGIDTGGGGGGGGGTPTNPLYRIGTLNGTTFTEGAVAIGNTPLSAGGQTSVSVDIVDNTGQRVNAVSAVVSFSSDCAATQQSSFNPVTVTTTQGNASSTYVASGCSGTDVVRASALVNGSTITAQGSLSVTSAALGSVTFVSATPTFVGMLGSPYASQSTLVYRVTNVNGGPVPNTRVTFTPSNAVGGLFVSPIENTTDANGLVQTTLNAGSAQTVVRVRASAQVSSGQTLTTQSEQLIISTGIPDADSVSLSVEKFSLDGRCDGDASQITIRLADRYNNPVPANTAVSFTAEGGKINSACFTGDPIADPLTEAGVCSVLFNVQNPVPADGRVSILASALGEESFTDQNSNGYFDSGETIKHILEPFVDNNENGVYNAGEFFRDANQNSTYETTLNTTFEGYLCESPGVNCRSVTTPIGQNIVISFSDGRPVDSALSGNLPTYAPSSSGMFTVTVADTNGNSLPTGTTYALTISNGTVLAPTTLGPFNTNSGDNLRFRFTAGATPSALGVNERATLTVTTPGSACRGSETIPLDLFTYRVQ